VQVDLLVALKV